MTRPNSSHTGKRRRNRARGESVAPALTAERREECEAAIGYRFKSPELLDRALTHRSAAQGKAVEWSNERLEFLGDRVLALTIVETLLERFPKAREGELAPRLNSLVSRETCAAVAAQLGLETFVLVDRAERANGPLKASLLANAIEAVLGAVYLDAGLAAARKFVMRHWKARLAACVEAPRDPKSALQEWAQGAGHAPPRYIAAGRTGPDHAPIFTTTVTIDGFEPATGSGSSKQEAERTAARALLISVAESWA